MYPRIETGSSEPLALPACDCVLILQLAHDVQAIGRANRLVVIEALAALLAEPASIDHLAQQYAGAVLGVSGLHVKYLHDGQAGVQADEVSQLQGAHGDVGAVLHDAIDGFTVADARLQAYDGLVDVGHQDAVGEEAGRVGRHGWDLAHGLAERDGGLQRLGARLEAGDDLYALLNGHGVHEVRGHDAGAVGRVGRVALGGGGRDARDADGRGVGGEDGMLGAYFGELREDVKLELGDLGNRFYHEVYFGEGIHRRGRGQEGSRCVGFLLSDPRLGHILGKQLL